MRAGPTNFAALIEGNRQYEVPSWQRRYAWRTDQWETLWKHAVRQYEVVQRADGAVAPVPPTHFLGSFVLSPRIELAADMARFRVVDGQQRITTLLILVAAIRDAAGATEPLERERIHNTFLVNQYRTGDDHLKLLPSEADRAAFRAVVTGADAVSGLIGAAFVFFANKIRVELERDHEFSLSALEAAVATRLEVVEIATEANDNVHRIFQTLNSSGVKLAPVDLIRNHFFMLLGERGEVVHEEVWRPMEQELGLQELNTFLFMDIVRRAPGGERYYQHDVYRAYQEDVEPIENDEARVETYLRELRARASVYRRIVDPTGVPDEGMRLRLQRLNEWGTVTIQPLVLHILLEHDAGRTSADEAAQALLFVESYLVRRMVFRIPTNNLSRIFGEIVGQLPRRTTLSQAVRDALSGSGKYWPTDEELRARVSSEEFFRSQRSPQRQFVLRRLEEALPHEANPDWDAATLTVEHVMPQTLTDAWVADLQEAGETDPIQMHSELVHTIGNLTLTPYNPELGNRPFREKMQMIVDQGPLEMNRQILQEQKWGREEIVTRGRDLAEQIITLWPGPTPGMGGTTDVTDWDAAYAAVDALPEGKWTTYAALAEVVGVPMVEVRGRLHTHPPRANAHRILLSNRRVDPTAPWAASNFDAYIAQLVAEGVLVAAEERSGDASGFVSGSDLAQLVGGD